MMVWVKGGGYWLVFFWIDYLCFVGLGMFIFLINFMLFYYGVVYLFFGLFVVVFLMVFFFNFFFSLLLFGVWLSLKVVIVGILGFGGIVFMFWLSFVVVELNVGIVMGFVLCIVGMLSFCIGNMLFVDM